METEELRCIKGHTYDRKWRNPGEMVTVRRRHSAVLIALGRMTRETSNVIPLIPLKSVPSISLKDEHSEDSRDAAVSSGERSPDELRASIRAEYKALFGKDAHGRTSVERLADEIAKKKEELNG